MSERPSDLFTDASASALVHPDVATGTMMGSPAADSGRVLHLLRPTQWQPHRQASARARRAARRRGHGQAGRPGRAEVPGWVVIDERDETRWDDLIGEARMFVAGQR